jgi:hypothetical protein
MILVRPLPLLLIVLAVAGVFVAACGSGGRPSSAAGVTVEARATQTPAQSPSSGGKPATPALAASDVSPTPAPERPTAAVAAAEAAPTASAAAADPLAPTKGRWIDVDVTRFAVRLMDGTAVVKEIAPVAVGKEIDTGAYESTQTGLFHVYNKTEDLAWDAPYQTYISHWVGFDPEKANGFHSFLKDKDGHVVDASTGNVSNGCIRTGDEAAIFAFAEIGMPVYVHG